MKPVRNLGAGIHAAFTDSWVRFLLALTCVMITTASIFYRWAEGWSWLDAAYFSVITISTIGYGDFSPQTAMGKVFTIFYVISGLGIFVVTASAIAERIISSARHDSGVHRPDR
ncbi:potassium channel family protein [Falsirhodobacter sp. alg1]|uniref:potassium channel family protein n=1 Tax=Falsirhodobacter sp. alg1 TaxID=1472418 RepID=UPI0005EDE0C2|nr:potassium channel family protein [Falsirhodobacter sp. alg1]